MIKFEQGEKAKMKRLKPEARRQIVKSAYDKFYIDWTCRYGAWNRDKMLVELMRRIKLEMR